MVLNRQSGGAQSEGNMPQGKSTSIADLQRQERHRVADLIRADKSYRETEFLRTEAEREFTKRRGETDLEFRARLAQAMREGKRFGDIITPETARQGDYGETFVTHVESNTKAQTMRNRRYSALELMHEKGTITPEQFGTYQQICEVAEKIARGAGVKTGSLVARVDNSGGNRDLLLERLAWVRLEATYTTWRNRLPMPRAMVLEMITLDRDLKATARVYNKPWPKARAMMLRSLDLWNEIHEAMHRQIDEQDVERIYRGLGEGELR